MPTDFSSSTLTTLAHALASTPFPTATYYAENGEFQLLDASNLVSGQLPQKLTITLEQFEDRIKGDLKVYKATEEVKHNTELFEFATQAGFEKVAFLPVQNSSEIQGLVVVGNYAGQSLDLDEGSLKSLTSLTDLACTIFEQAKIVDDVEKRNTKTETLLTITNAIQTPWNTTAFFESLHEKIKRAIGNHTFVGALYDEKTSSINIPYLFEEDQVRTLDSFPIGEGLTSVLLRSKQPLLLNNNVQEQAQALGAIIDGRPAKSWMGAPLLVDDQAIGALIVQDLEKEEAFTKDQLDYLCNLADQVTRILFNAKILDEYRNQINKVQAAAEIARDISSALNLDELLLKAVNLIRERFNFYHASIFLIDPSEKNAIIRESTGEAGAQLKRVGHKLAVGSKSIVGFVSGQGEPLVVNDVLKDATHLPNPMLPDTRAEAAIPLKIGERILGVLDVQSTIPYSFSPSDINTLQILADQLATAVNNTELFAETQEHLSQHRLLHHITTSAASGTTLEEALTSAVEGLQVTLGGDRVSILLSDEERKHLVVKAWVGYSEDATDLTVPFGSGITGWVAAHRKPLRVHDISQDTRYIQVSSNTSSELAIPLIFRNDILGVLNVESEQVGAYNENDEEMLGTLAGSLAAIIANARLVDQIRKQAERERLLNEISGKIRRSTDIQTILSTTIQELRRVTGARRALIEVGIADNTTETIKEEPQASTREE